MYDNKTDKMDIIDLFLKRYSYKFPKGYIDINDQNDRVILESIFNNLGLELNEQEIRTVSRDKVPGRKASNQKATETETETETTNNISKKEIIDILEKEDLNDEQLKSIFSLISGVKYKEPILTYITSKGKGPAKEALGIYNKLVETGDINEYAEYIKNPKKYSDIPENGNFYEVFKPFSKELIDYLLSLEPSIGRVSTGKGEILLSIMLDDVRDAVGGGDINAGGKPVEVKNKGALPMGQGFQFGVNTIDSVYKDVEQELDFSSLDNEELEEAIMNEMSIKADFGIGTRPFGKFAAVYNALKEKAPEKVDEFNKALADSLKKRYVGIELGDLKISDFEQGDKLDWEELEVTLGKKIIKKYIEEEGFKEIVFLNDKKKKYIIVPSNKILDEVGKWQSNKKIWIKFPDGAPRWSYAF